MNSVLPPVLRAPPGKQRQTTGYKASPEHRVKVLLSFPFSPEIREHTIKELLLDPVTKDLTQKFLSKTKCPHCKSY